MKTDRAQFQVIETGEGFLKARVTFAVPGVFPYAYEDGLRLEAKLPDDILSTATIESARGVPITDGHPEDENGNPVLVTPDNYSRYAKGNLSEPRVEIVDGRAVGVALATIYDSALIQSIKQHERDSVSIGFVCDEDFTPGQLGGVNYDSAQKNIFINHLACVDIARAGEATKIHIDRGVTMDKKIAAGAAEGTPDDTKTFSYRKFDGSTDIQVSKELHSELMALRNQIKADNDQIEALKSEIAQIAPTIPDPAGETEKAALMEKLEMLQSEVNAWKEKYSQLESSIPEMVDEMAEEKVDVLEVAKEVGDVNVDGLSVKEIKMQIIAKALPFKDGVKIDGISNDAINARFDAAVELLKRTANVKSVKQEIKMDRAEIEAKRAALQNMYRGGK